MGTVNVFFWSLDFNFRIGYKKKNKKQIYNTVSPFQCQKGIRKCF